jgi:hypothetical protein
MEASKMKTKKIFFLLAVIFTSINLYSQVTQEWVRTYNGQYQGSDEPIAVAVDSSGNVYVTGTSAGNGGIDSWEYEYVTIKYNSNGVQQWLRKYNYAPGQTDAATAMVIDNSGNIYVTGTSGLTMLSGGEFYATIKYNSSGAQIWQATYGSGTAYNIPRSMKIYNNSYLYIIGESWNAVTNGDFVTVKYDTSGNLQWARTYNTSDSCNDIGVACDVDILGNVYVTGYSSIGHSDLDFVTIKYNSAGVQQWVRTYNSVADSGDVPFSISVDNAGNSYVGGYSKRGVNWDIVLLKYDANGLLQWEKFYPGPNRLGYFGWADYDNNPVQVYLDAKGHVYIAASTMDSQQIYMDIVVLKYSVSGSLEWASRFNSSAYKDDVARCIVLDNSGSAYVAGYSYVSPSRNWDYVTLKLDSNGVRQWDICFNGSEFYYNYDVPTAICLDRAGNVIVTGCMNFASHRTDCCTIKYSQSIGIQPISSNVPAQFTLYQNYPNPFNPVTKIKFDIPLNVKSRHGGTGSETANVKIIVFDILAREVATLVDEQLKAGTYEVEWDGSNNPSGVYFYKLVADDYVETRKMILLK